VDEPIIHDLIIHDDENRVASLRALGILDAPPDPAFDRITELAARLFEAEISLISLVDDHRQWFLSSHGLAAKETPRDIAFCIHSVASGEKLYVPDALQDERFAHNPLVTKAPFIRTYLGYPLRTSDGAIIGTLNVIDSQPNKFEGHYFGKLKALAATVEMLLDAHRQKLENADLMQKLAETNKKMATDNRIFAQAESAAMIGSWEINCETNELTWSEGVYEIHGMEVGSPITVEEAIMAYGPDDRDSVSAAVKMAIVERSSFQYEGDLQNRKSGMRKVHARGEFLPADNINPDRVVGIINDITESHHDKMALQHAADFDSLTDLYNRHAFDRILGETIKRQRAEGQRIAVMMLDLDGFKAINDTFGHLVGDMVLEEVSGRLIRCTDDEVIAARWGGDEFVFIAPLGATKADVEALWYKLSEAVQEPFYISGRKLVLHATGGAEVSAEAMGGRELVRRADLAMYDVKKRNSGTLQFYGSDLEKSNKEKHEAIAQVREAIDAGRLYSGYQPIVDLLTDEVIGLEALMRLRTRNGNELTASNVMPAILDPHISREIGEEMVRFICSDFAEIDPVIERLRYISINATEADLLSRNYSSNILENLDKAGIRPDRVTLEVTETMLMVNDYETALQVLSEISEAGVQIALDDFGTGYSSLTHLRDFPIDIVKIDQSFIKSLCSSQQSRLIVQAMIAMARNLDIDVVAEGIEKQSQRDLLMQMGCRYGQGYLLGIPQTSGSLKAAALKNRPTLPAIEPDADSSRRYAAG